MNLPENTTYTTKNSAPTPGLNISRMIRNLHTVTKKTNPVVNSNINPQPIIPPSAPATMPNLGVTSSAFETGVPLEQVPQDVKYSPLPSYGRFLPTDTQYPNAPRWVSPTEQAKTRTLKEQLGGGQYTVDPSQPGALIKAQRVLVDDKVNPGFRQKILGNLSGQDFEVDHNIPLWAGGADTMGNLEVLDKPTHSNKTKNQAVALTLLENGKITKDQARVMALSWKDNDSSIVPEVDDKGRMPLVEAERVAAKWKEVPSFTKYYGESFREKMGEFGRGWLPEPIREFGKGLVGGGAAGIVPGTE